MLIFLIIYWRFIKICEKLNVQIFLIFFSKCRAWSFGGFKIISVNRTFKYSSYYIFPFSFFILEIELKWGGNETDSSNNYSLPNFLRVNNKRRKKDPKLPLFCNRIKLLSLSSWVWIVFHLYYLIKLATFFLLSNYFCYIFYEIVPIIFTSTHLFFLFNIIYTI